MSSSVSMGAARCAALTRRTQRAAARRAASTATSAASTATTASAETETYDATLPKPIQLKWGRGNDGGAYVVGVPENDPLYADFAVGDKIINISASFGNDIWEAQNYGQVMYAMRTRNGDIYVKMKKMNGDMSALEVSENSQFQNERAGGNYGAGTQELQRKNYAEVKELEAKRLKMFDEAIAKYNSKDYEAALIMFEDIIGLEPKNYMGDSFQMTSDVYRVSQYNLACCYSQLQNGTAGLEALEAAMRVGFDDYRKIRNDKSLAFLQQLEGFKPIMNKYDEPLINENAMKMFKGIFGGGK
mmetsp:Transcript_7076/g.23451  ORF Transcript_7076/g.23451 Transcript_7076/m.23451 type:complete len:301 (+) Transcript_7076:25-927(+)